MLLCSATFKAIKHMAPELGGVTQNDAQADQLNRPTWGWLWRWAQRTHTAPFRIQIQILLLTDPDLADRSGCCRWDLDTNRICPDFSI